MQTPSLSLSHGRPYLILRDENTQERVHLFIENGGTPALELKDGNGQARLICYMTDEGVPHVVLHDGVGKTRLELTTDGDDFEPIVTLHNSDGEPCMQMTLDFEGTPSLNISGENNTWQTWLKAKATKEG